MWRTIARPTAGTSRAPGSMRSPPRASSTSYPTWVRTSSCSPALRAAVETRDVALATRLLGQSSSPSSIPSRCQPLPADAGPDRRSRGQGRRGARHLRAGDRRRHPPDPRRGGLPHPAAARQEGRQGSTSPRPPRRCRRKRCCGAATGSKPTCRSCWPSSISRKNDYRDGFETVKQAVAYYPRKPPINALLGAGPGDVRASSTSTGGADELSDLEALSLYYDFRQLTPPGAARRRDDPQPGAAAGEGRPADAGRRPARVPDRQPPERRRPGAGRRRPCGDPHRRPRPRGRAARPQPHPARRPFAARSNGSAASSRRAR